MPYTPEKPALAEPTRALRERIPGWGADLDPADRPAVPREVFAPATTGAHWQVPDRQPEERPRERSIEHAGLTPAFGTAQPATGLSGAMRRLAYARFSEGRAAHWLLLIAADRVNVVEATLRSFLSLHPDDPVTEWGLLAEFRHRPVASRRGRVDVRHQALDPLVNAAPWLLGGWLVWRVVRRAARARS